MQDTLLQIISLGAIVLIVASLFFIACIVFKIPNPVSGFLSKHRLNVLFAVSLMGTVGSILLSIYFKLQPCELCWYQRLFLFSTPVITAIAVIKEDLNARLYVLWLSVIGLLISVYHILLQAKFFAPDSVFCNPASAIDCSVAPFVYFGFVTVPVISFSVFLLLIVISYDSKKI